MKTTVKVNLINGWFSAEKSIELLQSLFETKMLHHKQRIKDRELNAKDRAFAEKRIQELQDELDQIVSFLKEMKVKGKLVELQCPITISTL